jgi:RNA polymerase sigma factor (sigma-70 family)
MTRSRPSGLIHYLRASVRPRGGDGQTDGELLERFVAERDGAAFASLVRRHGPMVLGVCRRVLHDPDDAEDAFQATFLVLVRRAAAVAPREAVGNWLYGVAYRTALGARRAAARRRAKEREVAAAPKPEPRAEDAWSELRPVLDQELNGLPDKYRLPVVLCDLEGRSRRDVARQLKLPEGTLSSRLAAARKKLADRLTRRGLALSGGGLAVLLSQNAAPACLPARLVGSAVHAALAAAAGEAVAGGAVSAKAAALADGVMRAMVMSKVKNTALGLLLFGAVGAGGGDWVCRAYSADPAAAGPALAVGLDEESAARAPDQAAEEARRRAEEAVRQAKQRVEEAMRRAEEVQRQAEEAVRQAKRRAEEAMRQAEQVKRRAEAEEKEERARKEKLSLEEELIRKLADAKRRGGESAAKGDELARAKEQIAKLQAENKRLQAEVERLRKQLQTRPKTEGGDAAKGAAKALAAAFDEKAKENVARMLAEAQEKENMARKLADAKAKKEKESAARKLADAKRRDGEPAPKMAATQAERDVARFRAEVERELDRLKGAIERLQKQLAQPKSDDRDVPRKK